MLKVIGFLPVRKGSKGIPGKNLRELAGRPLLKYAADALGKADSIAESFCSSDCDQMLALAGESGLLSHQRPNHLASDTALMHDVLVNFVKFLEIRGDVPEFILLAQATSPFISPRLIDRAVRKAIDTDSDLLISAFRQTHSPLGSLFTSSDGRTVEYLFPEFVSVNRQTIPDVFRRGGAFYVYKTASLMRCGSKDQNTISFLEVSELEAFTIDEEADFRKAEFFMTQKAQY